MTGASYRLRWLHAGAIVLLGSMAGTSVQAAADPMRPLPAPGGAASAAAAGAVRDVAPAAPALPTLTAIREDAPTGQRQVLVGERWLAPGESLGARRITAIGSNHVELSDGRRHTRVYLLPPLQPAGEAGPAAERGPATRRSDTAARQP